MSDVAILVPVLNRPHRVEPLLQSIAEATDVPYRVIFACSDQATVDELDRLGAWYDRDEGGTYPVRINRLFDLTNERVCFLGADDLAFRPGWFQAAMRVMETLGGDGVVAINDLHNMAGVHFLVSRHYIDTVGGYLDAPGVVMFPEFWHQYCDDSLRGAAISRGKFARAPESIVEHLHPGAGKAPHDETYAIGAAAEAHDRQIFMDNSHLWQFDPS